MIDEIVRKIYEEDQRLLLEFVTLVIQIVPQGIGGKIGKTKCYKEIY